MTFLAAAGLDHCFTAVHLLGGLEKVGLDSTGSKRIPAQQQRAPRAAKVTKRQVIIEQQLQLLATSSTATHCSTQPVAAHRDQSESRCGGGSVGGAAACADAVAQIEVPSSRASRGGEESEEGEQKADILAVYKKHSSRRQRKGPSGPLTSTSPALPTKPTHAQKEKEDFGEKGATCQGGGEEGSSSSQDKVVAVFIDDTMKELAECKIPGVFRLLFSSTNYPIVQAQASERSS
eukprot:CAMPEP_0175158004 /NCGR_PEP_ID=MMETSP0087-20121206/22556_1 /TAXON_ID=136419 /ORGANISM="Unknown Unknown, Strain D1" /LENGTH=233 /DNA_ID=CAMNT_0016445755 /DNA_START=241 /DNA_END=942 /DNA_ORIENTATION=-